MDTDTNLTAVAAAEADTIHATASAIASARTHTLNTTGSAVGFAQVEGDARISLSAVPLVIAKGDADFKQAYASAFIASNEVSVTQGGAPLIMGRQVSVKSGGAVAVMAGQADISRGWVGLLLAKDATVAEDSRVVFTTKAALIIALALLGGFGLIAVGVYYGARRLAQSRPTISLWRRT